ncbi:MAG: hypothetical protein K0S20_41 [Patescibacteria group bacterium]|jgi:hypothetical protein|nr:hypothetical protein [Patescibacteria group bacterium]
MDPEERRHLERMWKLNALITTFITLILCAVILLGSYMLGPTESLASGQNWKNSRPVTEDPSRP